MGSGASTTSATRWAATSGTGWRSGRRTGVRSLLQIGTTSQAEGGWPLVKYRALLEVVRLFGLGAVYRHILPILYGPAYVADPALEDVRAEHRAWMLSNARAGIVRAGRGIFGRDDVSGRLHEIEVPTLVVTGTHDAAHPPAQGRADADRMPNAEFRALEGGHTPPLETPEGDDGVGARLARAGGVKRRGASVRPRGRTGPGHGKPCPYG